VPAFSLGQTVTSIDPIRLVSDERRADGVDDLAPHEQVARRFLVDEDDVLEEDEEKSEPHRRAQVVLYVSEAVEQFLLPRQPGRRRRGIHDCAFASSPYSTRKK